MAGSSRITLDESTHTYLVDGARVESVHNRIKDLRAPFDRDGISERIAKRRGWTKEEVLGDWDKKRDDACATGNALHDYVATVFGDNPHGLPVPPNKHCQHWLDWWLGASKHLQIVAHEEPICDLGLMVAGTPDLLALSSKTKLFHILDWKTNGEFKLTNQYGDHLLRPFNDLWDCELSIYSLQVSIYRAILERSGLAGKMGDGYLIHVTENKLEVHQALRLHDRAVNWLTNTL